MVSQENERNTSGKSGKSATSTKLPCVITSADSFNYAGRPIQLLGPEDLFTIQFTDRHGGFCWFDPETHNVWHRERSASNSLYYACSFYKICKLPGRCEATPDCQKPHNHDYGGVPLYHLRQIRLEFLVRNYYALSREVPLLDQFTLVYQFFHERVHNSSAPIARFNKVPNWIISSAKLGYPYSCESRRAGGEFRGVMEHPIRHVITILEVNAVFEAERFCALEQYVPCVLPPDYGEPKMLRPLVPTISYVRRWPIPRELSNPDS